MVLLGDWGFLLIVKKWSWFCFWGVIVLPWFFEGVLILVKRLPWLKNESWSWKNTYRSFENRLKRKKLAQYWGTQIKSPRSWKVIKKFEHNRKKFGLNLDKSERQLQKSALILTYEKLPPPETLKKCCHQKVKNLSFTNSTSLFTLKIKNLTLLTTF